MHRIVPPVADRVRILLRKNLFFPKTVGKPREKGIFLRFFLGFTQAKLGVLFLLRREKPIFSTPFSPGFSQV